ncbi:MAG: hypothetical protein H6626_05195 [Pseudobdellovibrionaceae bacterium]|nr:hypothetical protein [Bdellovibrionales bacterium]USN48488.1 MAG: hypothetical protein H6626_05195 [Pseudobdellovibrionaceae bacterium]
MFDAKNTQQHLFVLILAAFLFVGCKPKPANEDYFASESQITISGRAALGPIQNGYVNVYLLNADGSRDLKIGNGRTYSDGSFSVELSYPQGVSRHTSPVELAVYGGSYRDENSNLMRGMGANEEIRSWLPGVGDYHRNDLGVTIITEMAAQSAAAKLSIEGASSSANLRDNIQGANALFSAAFDVDISRAPGNIFSGGFDASTDAGKMASALAGLAVAAADLDMDHASLASIYASDSLDGSFNGQVFDEIIVVAASGVDVSFADSQHSPMDIVDHSIRKFWNKPHAPINASYSDFSYSFNPAPTGGSLYQVDDSTSAFSDWKTDFSQQSIGIDLDAAYSGGSTDDLGIFYDANDSGAVAPTYPNGCDPSNFDLSTCQSSIDNIGGASGGGGSPALLYVTGGGFADFGTVNIGSLGLTQVTITNVGGETATGIMASALATPFSFNGGSYPGNMGTCTSNLAAGASCTIDLTFNPILAGSATDFIHVDYNDGSVISVLTIDVVGVGQ